MDIYDSPYFKLNKKMLCVFGLWPYDSRKMFMRTFWLSLVAVLMMPHAIGLVIDISDMDKLLEHLVMFLVLIAVFLKHLTLATAEKKMRLVYDGIPKNWLMITDEEERKILVDYSKRGRILTIIYICMLSFVGAAVILSSLFPEVLNAVDPLSVPRAHLYIFGGEFLVENRDDHFAKIFVWDAVTLISVLAICMAIDTMYTVSVEHCCALYAIVTHRLSKLRNQEHRRLDNSIGGVQCSSSYDWLVHTIKLHQIALSFTTNINESYSLCFLALTIMNIIALPTGCVVILISWGNPWSLFRYGLDFSSLMLHVFVLFWPGQKIINHSTRLLDDATYNEWYETSAETKKILRIFMLRCTQPSLITAGGLVVMNFENYFKVVKTSVSYITVVASFR